jgi:hypothetical protein
MYALYIRYIKSLGGFSGYLSSWYIYNYIRNFKHDKILNIYSAIV